MIEYPGIDYGHGKTNIDLKTGIRFGVIPNHAIRGYEDLEPIYVYFCPYCGMEFGRNYEDVCPDCKKEINDSDFWEMEPVWWTYTEEGYELFQSNNNVDIFVKKSPYYTYAQFCSPCAPGAGYLLNPVEPENTNNKCYCLGHEWFENDKAPYPVYSVATNELIYEGS